MFFYGLHNYYFFLLYINFGIIIKKYIIIFSAMCNITYFVHLLYNKICAKYNYFKYLPHLANFKMKMYKNKNHANSIIILSYFV